MEPKPETRPNSQAAGANDNENAVHDNGGHINEDNGSDHPPNSPRNYHQDLDGPPASPPRVHHHPPHQTNSPRNYVPHPGAPRELHTAESIMEYMHDLEQERQDPPKYKDYLHAQKHLKQARRRRSAFGILEEDAETAGDVHAGVSTRNILAAGGKPQSGRNLAGGGKSRRALMTEESNNTNKHRNKSIRAMSVLSHRHRSSEFNFSAQEWQAFMDREPINIGSKSVSFDEEQEGGGEDHPQESEEEEDHHGGGGHNLTVPWYCRPVQRQRWDDDQVLPHINWGDLFFDLFYVAAAYNLGGMLISAMNPYDWPRGVLYFVAIFGPLYNIWENDVVYSSRYTLVDYSHRFIAVVRFFCVSFAVLSIKPLTALHDKASVETFCFTLALFCESIMQLGLNIELYFYGEGDRTAIQNHTYKKIVTQFVPASLTYMTAAIIAGVNFFSAEDHAAGYHDNILEAYHEDETHGDAYHGDAYHHEEGYEGHYDNNGTTFVIISEEKDHHAEDPDHADTYGHFLFRLLAAAAPSGCKEEGGHRNLAGGGGYGEEDCAQAKDWSIADVPLMLCLAIYVFNIIYMLVRRSKEPGQDIREQYVPSNIDYMIHRYGEWIILMIGESILSLLIVETIETGEYYATAGVGCLTVIVIQMLKFESEPSHADGHALWRSRRAAALFSLLIQILSMGLIAFGVSYKVMLNNVLHKELQELVAESGESGHRQLAGVPLISDQATSSLFCAALTVVLLSLEMMLGSHKGVTKSYGLLFHEIESFDLKSLNWPLMVISLFKVVVILFTATLSQWATRPGFVAICGFFIVTAMALTRIVGWGFVHHEAEIKEAWQFVADQTSAMGQNMVQASNSVAFKAAKTGENMFEPVARTTGSIAKKTFQVASSFGLEADSLRPRASNSENALDRDLWETSFDAVLVTDRAGVICYANTTALKEFGYKSEWELNGKNISILVGGGEAANHSMYLDRFNKNEKMSTTIGKQRKLKARRKDGSEFQCLIGIKVIQSTGNLVGFIRPLEELAQQKHEVYQVDDTSFDSILVIDPRGTIIDLNLTALTEFGFASKDELLGKGISTLVGGGEAEHHDAYLAKFHEEKRSASTIGQKRILYAKRKDGSEFPCSIGIKKVPGSENLIGYVRNMTGISLEDMALKEQFKYLVDDTSFDCIIVTDFDGKMLQVNATAVEEFRYDAKTELVGQNIDILVGGGMQKKHGKFMQRFKTKGDSNTVFGKQRTLKARRKDGSEFKCVIGVKRVPDTEYLIGYIRSTQGLSKKEIAAEFEDVSRISKSGVSLAGTSQHSARMSQGGGASVGSNDNDHILDESFDAIIVTDLKGIIKRCNQTVLDIYRYESKDELIGKNISMLVGGPDAEVHDAYLENFQKEGKSSSQIGKQRVLYSKRKDGTEFPCIVGIKRTPKNDGLVGWIRDMSDVTEAKKRESIQITNMKLLDPVERLVDDKSFDAIVVTDYKGVIQQVNKTTLREFRYDSKEELIGKNVSDLVGGKVSARTHGRYMERFQKTGKSSTTIGRQRILKSSRKDGSEFRCIIGINKIEESEDDLLIGYIRNLDGAEKGQEHSSDEEATSASVGQVLDDSSTLISESSNPNIM